jgi:hypothetical protein
MPGAFSFATKLPLSLPWLTPGPVPFSLCCVSAVSLAGGSGGRRGGPWGLPDAADYCRPTSGAAGWSHVRFFASLRMTINKGLRMTKEKVFALSSKRG